MKLQEKKPRRQRKWCHVICAQYISETWFDPQSSIDQLSNVCNVDGIYSVRYQGICCYCSRTKGAKVFCSLQSCNATFHASCGLVNNCKLLDIAEPNAEYSNRVVYCPLHTQAQINNLQNRMKSEGGRITSVEDQKIIAEFYCSQDVSKGGNANSLGWGQTWDTIQQNRMEYEYVHGPLLSSDEQNKKKKKIKKIKTNSLSISPEIYERHRPPSFKMNKRRNPRRASRRVIMDTDLDVSHKMDIDIDIDADINDIIFSSKKIRLKKTKQMLTEEEKKALIVEAKRSLSRRVKENTGYSPPPLESPSLDLEMEDVSKKRRKSRSERMAESKSIVDSGSSSPGTYTILRTFAYIFIYAYSHSKKISSY